MALLGVGASGDAGAPRVSLCSRSPAASAAAAAGRQQRRGGRGGRACGATKAGPQAQPQIAYARKRRALYCVDSTAPVVASRSTIFLARLTVSAMPFSTSLWMMNGLKSSSAMILGKPH